MSKTARSARVGSRQRPEVVSGDKTLTQAESGEIYFLVNDLPQNALQITLPTPETGSYFKFILTDGKAGLALTSSASNILVGSAQQVIASGSAHAGHSLLHVNAQRLGAHTKLLVPISASAGSYVECVSDGQTWFLTAQVSGVLPVFSD
jgi:hypothetical protein